MYEPMAADVSSYCRTVAFANTDSHLIHILSMNHPSGVYERDIYYKGSLLYSAGTPYPAGPWLTTIAGQYIPGSAGGYYQPPDNDAMKARFHNPQGLAITQDANTVYVSDSKNHVIRKLTRGANDKWEITLFAGTPSTAGNTGDGGAAANARLNEPIGISLDYAEMNLYIADMNNHKIRKIDLSSGIITTAAGNGQIPPNQYTNVNDGTAAQHGKPLNQVALFKYLSDIAIDANGNIYVADQSQNRIRKILHDLSEIRTIYGNGYETLVKAPRGIELNWAGEVFVSDTESAKIWRLVPDGLTDENYPDPPPCRITGICIPLSANKRAVGKVLGSGEFEFAVFDKNGMIVAAARNESADR
jgi:sugar lactone lactonase YvrE